MSIPAKQVRSSTFTLAQVNRVFGSGSIDTGVLANDAIGATQLDATAFGNGLTGGGGTAVAVEADATGGANLATAISVTANGVAIQIDDTGIEENGSSQLQLKDAGVTNAKLNADVAGAGITGGAGSALAFDVAANLTITGIHSHTPSTLQVTGTPTTANQAVNKAYVDSVGAGVDIKEACEVATTAALPTVVAAGSQVGKTLTASAVGILTIDGQATVLGDRIMVKDQVDPIDNGLYSVTTEGTAGVAFVLTRTTDADGNPSGEVSGGMLAFIKAGTLNANTGWALYGIVGTVDVDTDPQTFTQFQGISLVGGDGIDITGNTVSVELAPTSGLEFNAAQLRTSAQGNGLTGGAGSLLAVQPDQTPAANTQPVSVQVDGVGLDVAAIAGAGIEADGSATLRVAAQGTGIAGGGGTTLSFDATAADGDGLIGAGAVLAVQPNTTDGGTEPGLEVGLNGVRISLAAAGNGLTGGGGNPLRVEPDNVSGGGVSGLDVASSGVRISTAAAGNGLTGGGGAALAVDPTDLVSGGSAEVDGDTIDIDWVPTNYTRDTGPAEVTTAVQLTAHLKGIDNAILAAGGTPRQESVTTQNITGTDTVITSDTLDNTPTSAVAVKLYLNGILIPQGAGLYYTISGVNITWLAGGGTAVDLDTSDELLAVYES
jgi:hypothetical protein